MIDLMAIAHCIPDFLRATNISAHEFNSVNREMAHIGGRLL